MGKPATSEDGKRAASYARARQMLMPFLRAEAEGCAAEGTHHLSYERYKGWTLRVTVQVGKKVMGKRLKFYLKTRDRAEAEAHRELVLGVLRKLGLTVKLRPHRRGERSGR